MNAPVRFEPFLRPMVWGGRRLAEVLGKSLPASDIFGESWEVSDHALHRSRAVAGPTRGRLLCEMMEETGASLLGPRAPEYRHFPWLVKFLDACDWLSVQVHPDERAVRELLPGEGSKTEAWFILDAQPGSRVYAGLRPGVGSRQLRDALAAGSVTECLHSFEPRAGDCVFLPAGTVHAVGGGVLMAEIQQTSDATFRLFDWNRRDASGKSRALHIDESLACIDWSRGPVDPVRVESFARPAGTGPEVVCQMLVQCEYFHLDYVQICKRLNMGGLGKLQAFIALRGQGHWETPPRPGANRGGTRLALAGGDARAALSADWNPRRLALHAALTHGCGVQRMEPNMRVVINQATALGQKAGIGHYTDQLVRRLRVLLGGERLVTFPNGWMRAASEIYSRTRSSLYTGRDNALPGDGPRDGLLARARRAAMSQVYRAGQGVMGWHFRSLTGRQTCDLYHEPNMLPLPCDCRTVATFHDLSLLLHPEWHTAERARHFERNLPRALRQCEHFLTDSDFIRRQMIDVLGMAPERVTRVYLGIRAGLEPMPAVQVAEVLAALGLPARYLLVVGTIEPRKNLLPVLYAYCDLPAALRERWPLLLVGRWGWNAGPVADFLTKTGLSHGVLHLGYLPDAALPAVYNGARALVYPSLYEGFGLPPLEMLACGGAVLASTADTLVELVGRQAHCVPPEDVDGWRHALERVLTDDAWWQTLRTGAPAVAQAFTWENCAAETLDVYQRVCGQAEPARRAAG